MGRASRTQPCSLCSLVVMVKDTEVFRVVDTSQHALCALLLDFVLISNQFITFKMQQLHNKNLDF